MSYRINDKELAEVLGLESGDRSSYFIGLVAENKQFWAAKNDDGWLVPIAPDETPYFPVWPHPSFVEKVVEDRYPGYLAVEISVDELIDYWAPRFNKDGLKVAVFPNEEWRFWMMEPDDLLSALKEELK